MLQVSFLFQFVSDKFFTLSILHRTISLFLLLSSFCGIIFLPDTSRAQAKPKQFDKDKITSFTRIEKSNDKVDKFVASNYKTPISFEPNNRQIDGRVKFRANGLPYNFFLTAGEAVMVYNKPIFSEEKLNLLTKKPSKYRSSILRMKFIGANKEPEITPSGILQYKRNYFSGRRKTTEVSNYEKVIYSNLYPGIGLTFYSNQQSLEYDFKVAPGTDISNIRIKFEGAKKINIDPNGDLVLDVNGQEVRHKKPVIYQEIENAKKFVDGKYEINKNGEVGFIAGRYDSTKELIIDPIISFSTYLGGSNNETVTSTAVDKQGNVYLTGTTYSSNFPTRPGSYDTTFNADNDVFVTKLNSDGTVSYSTFLGGSGNFYEEIGHDIAVDSDGNAYIAGYTTNNTFPTTSGAYKTTFTGGSSPFVTKLNAQGNGLIFSTFITGNTYSIGNGTAIGLDSMNNVIVSGFTLEQDFPTTTGAFQTSPAPCYNENGFVSKLNAAGSSLMYSTYLGGSGNERISAITVDGAGNTFITGDTTSNEVSPGCPNGIVFPTTPGAFQGSAPDTTTPQSFVTKLNASGSALTYSTFLGGDGNDFGYDIAVDSGGNAYIVGVTSSSNFPVTSGVVQSIRLGNTDSFVTKLNNAGSAQIYSTYLGITDTDQARGITLTTSGNVYVTGDNSGTFQLTSDALETTPGPGFIARLNLTGSAFEYASYLLGAGRGVSLDSCENVYLVGDAGVEFQTRNAFQPTFGGVKDGFVSKLAVLKKLGAAPDASSDGPLPSTVSEYKLSASIDTEILDLTYDDGTTDQPLQVELWASIYRPSTLPGTQYPLLIFLHGMHETCVRNSTPLPPGSPTLPASDSNSKNLWYPLTGQCDDLDTPGFDESPYYDIIENHRGYDYLGQKLASWGYIVVSINANRGIHAAGERVTLPGGYPDPSLILPRANLILRHLQKLNEWNNCTTNPACQSLPSAGVDLRGKLNFSNVGLMGHSRGGQAVRAAFNLYKKTGSPWQTRIPSLDVKGIFEIAPTDAETNRGGIIPDPDSRFIAYGTKWNVLLPMCDSDLFTLEGVRVFDRMLLGTNNTTPNPPSNDNPAFQKSTKTVWGANHNFYNTKWDYHDVHLDQLGYRCVENDPLFDLLATGSEKQKQTARADVLAFFRANVGNTVDPNYNKNFNSSFDLPGSIQAITRVEQGYTPTPNPSSTKVFDDFATTSTNTYDIGTPTNVQYSLDHIQQHDPSLNVAVINWTTSGSSRYFQTNWSASGSGVNISTYQTLDFRASRVRNVVLNSNGSTNFSIQLVAANGSLSSSVKLCKYIYLDGPVGGYDINYTTSTVFANYRPILQSVRIPLADFSGINLSQVRGIRLTFDETQTGQIYLANIRLNK